MEKGDAARVDLFLSPKQDVAVGALAVPFGGSVEDTGAGVGFTPGVDQFVPNEVVGLGNCSVAVALDCFDVDPLFV